MTQYNKNPIQITWLVPYVVFFGSSCWMFLYKYVQAGSADRVENALASLLFLTLIAAYVILYVSFRIEINNDTITVVELGTRLFKRNNLFPLSDIGVVYIRQSPFNKLFGLKNIILELKDPKYWDEALIKGFGMSKKTFNASMPGKYGGLITIPSVSAKEADVIMSIFKSNTTIAIKEIGIGYPYLNRIVYLSNIILYGALTVSFIYFVIWIFSVASIF